MGYLLLSVVAFVALIAGCAPDGIGESSLPGTWSRKLSSVTVTYIFNADGSAKFNNIAYGRGSTQIEGAWYLDNDKLGLAFNGLPTVEVGYSISGDQLTIVDDPATVPAGTHTNAVYTRVK